MGQLFSFQRSPKQLHPLCLLLLSMNFPLDVPELLFLSSVCLCQFIMVIASN